MLVPFAHVFLAFASSGETCPMSEQLPIKLFNDAGASNFVFQQATTEAAWLLQSVCLEILWIHCPVINTENVAECPAPAGSVELHILATTKNPDLTTNSLGIAFPNQKNRRAGVFLLRVREIVAVNGAIISEGSLLGHVIAHEIGHLLLRSSAHSSEGLMRAEFRKEDLLKAKQRQLTFTKAQREAIQRNVVARVR